MIIKRVHIDNFGKLKNKDFDFSRGINQLVNENGWGKTTLSIFLKAMFFGMSPARENVKNERKKYMPWQGGTFGGWIEFSSKQGDLKLVRSFAKTPEGDTVQLIELKTNQLISLPKQEIGEWLFGVGRETFEMTAFFPQSNFTASVNEQISAGVLGLDKFKYDLANAGDAMARLKKEVSLLKKGSVKQEEIERLCKKKNDLAQDLMQLQLNIQEIDNQISYEKENSFILEEKLALEKTSLQDYENVYVSKMNIEKQLHTENEKLASLLMANDGEGHFSRKNINWIMFIAIFVMLTGVVLGVSQILSWAFASIVCGVGLIFCVLGILLKAKGKKTKSSQKGNKNEIKKQISDTKKRIESLKKDLLSYESLSLPNKKSVDHQQELVFGSKLTIERLNAQKKSLIYQKDTITTEIDGLTDEIDKKLQTKNFVDSKIQVVQLAYDFLAKAKENISERFVGPINQGMKKLLNKFNMRGREYVVDANFDIKEFDNTGMKDFEHSSQGYKDILSICMRFLLVEQIYKQEMPCIVLDDSFVNLDDENFKRAKMLVDDFAQKMQILYITCNESKRF